MPNNIQTNRKKKPVEYHFVDMNDPERYKKLKVARACDFCRRRKSKCDAGTPGSAPCSNCQKHQIDCYFSHLQVISNVNGNHSPPSHDIKTEGPPYCYFSQPQVMSNVNGIHSPLHRIKIEDQHDAFPSWSEFAQGVGRHASKPYSVSIPYDVKGFGKVAAATLTEPILTEEHVPLSLPLGSPMLEPSSALAHAMLACASHPFGILGDIHVDYHEKPITPTGPLVSNTALSLYETDYLQYWDNMAEENAECPGIIG